MSPNNNAEIQSIVMKLSHHLLRGSLKFSLCNDEINILTPEVQEIFLQSTIQDERFKKYPLNNDFCIKFFKKLIIYLEPYQQIHDDIYIFLCSTMGKSSEGDGFCYHHYVLENNIDHIVTIKETKNMVVNGTTGMKTWEAAFMLCDWALCNKERLENKKVLELGSGVGFTGVAIAKYCNMQSMILTDCHDAVLTTIQDNIRINFPDFNEEQTHYMTKFADQNQCLGVMMLDWTCLENLPDEIVPDILIGADIVYDPSIIPALCSVIKTFLQKNNNLEVYIASVIRNEDTFRKFQEALEQSNLSYDEILLLQPVCVNWDPEIGRKFLKIKNK